MTSASYIQVILPLKLEWEPCYMVESQAIHVGERVRVKFANKEYIGVVSKIGVTPDIDPSRILPVLSIEKDLEKVLPQEIELWRQISEYYLCSIGEVYKAAYPASKITLEEARATFLKAAQARRDKLLKSMQDRVLKLEEQTSKTQEQIKSAKDGTKKKAHTKRIHRHALALGVLLAHFARSHKARIEGAGKAGGKAEIKNVHACSQIFFKGCLKGRNNAESA